MALMDRFRARIAQQQVASSEVKKKQKQAMLGPNIISLVVYIPMVIIGYKNNGLCDMDAPLYLLIEGGIGLALTLLKIVSILTPSDCDDKFSNCMMPVASLFGFGVMIWGSIVVFGAYSSWTDDEKDKDNKDFSYCPYTPFMLAFVILILEWVLKPFLACCEICLACLSCCTFMSPPADSSTEYTVAATSDSPAMATSIIKQQSEKC